jgi:hypothetical protein
MVDGEQAGFLQMIGQNRKVVHERVNRLSTMQILLLNACRKSEIKYVRPQKQKYWSFKKGSADNDSSGVHDVGHP